MRLRESGVDETYVGLRGSVVCLQEVCAHVDFSVPLVPVGGPALGPYGVSRNGQASGL